MNTRLSAGLLAALFVFAASVPSTAWASSSEANLDNDAKPPVLSADPAYWLKKMNRALREENYEGIFTYMRGSTFDTVRIVHFVEDGVENERLYNLNGEVRELYRTDDEVLCLHPEGHALQEDFAEHNVQIGPFSPAFAERVLATQSLYRFSLHGTDRIAGRSAVKLAISPSFNDRYGYRLWLDEETGLLLQSHLLDRGNVKEVFQFTSLQTGDEIQADDLATAIAGNTVSHKLSFEMKEQPDKPVWRVSWLPDGFHPVRMQGNRLHFSDGLATFSVFVEKPEAALLPDLTTTVGGTVVITRHLKNSGSQITVVGEVPVQTAKRVAESVEPVIY